MIDCCQLSERFNACSYAYSLPLESLEQII